VLKPWIARRDALPPFVIRRDPRDISRVWVLEPDNQHYVEIPYRTPSHPALSLWEQRQALAQLRQQGRDQVDEAALFRMVGQMRDIAHSAQRKTRKVRRDTERREHLLKTASQCKPVVPVEAGPAAQAEGAPPAVPFDQIEEW
jgi:putative transposase